MTSITPRPPHLAPSGDRLTRVITAIFCPPFGLLPWLIWAYFIGCFCISPMSLITSGNLPDGDDYMYLTQLRDWLSGQSWYDNIQHRLDPAARVEIDFTRLPQLPMALLVKLFGPVAGTGAHAIMMMAAVLPPLYFAGLLFVLCWVAQLAVGKNYSRATAFIAIFGTYLIFQYTPGHIDHHGLDALLVFTGTGFAAYMLFFPEKQRFALGAGFFFALALVTGLEILPPLIVVSTWLGVLAMARGEAYAKRALTYGLTLFLTCAAFLGVLVPTDLWFYPDQLGFSIVYVIFAGSLALCFAAIALAAQTRSRNLRYVGGLTAAVVTGGFFLRAFPALIHGPYGAMNNDLAAFMFENIPEAISIVNLATSPLEFLLRVLWPLMGLAAAGFLFRRAKSSNMRWFWGLCLLTLGVHLALAVFYQIRFMVLAQLFTVVPLTGILVESFLGLGASQTLSARARFFLELEILFFIAPVPMVLLPAIVTNSPINTGVILFPVQQPEYYCDAQSIAEELNRVTGDDAPGTRPHLIMNDIAYGPELLYRTRHVMLMAPFHTDVAGNLDGKDFFMATDPDKAEAILRGRNADFVVLCRNSVPLYRGHEKNGGLTLADRLNQGDIPPWLEPLHYADEKDFLFFRLKGKETP